MEPRTTGDTQQLTLTSVTDVQPVEDGHVDRGCDCAVRTTRTLTGRGVVRLYHRVSSGELVRTSELQAFTQKRNILKYDEQQQ